MLKYKGDSMRKWLALFLPIVIIMIVCGCSMTKSKSEQRTMEYLKNHYPSNHFKLTRTDGDPKGVTYWAAEKKHPNVSAYITYYPQTGQVKENIPVALIYNEFEQYIVDKIEKSFPHSKVYSCSENSIDAWNSWDRYEYSLDNYLNFLDQHDVSGKGFTVVLDSNDYNSKRDQLQQFYSDIDQLHYVSLRLFYVPTNYLDQADRYFTGSGFAVDTLFYKSHASDEWIYVWGSKGNRYLHSSKDGDLK